MAILKDIPRCTSNRMTTLNDLNVFAKSNLTSYTAFQSVTTLRAKLQQCEDVGRDWHRSSHAGIPVWGAAQYTPFTTTPPH
jgi:hypothetical protein